MKKTIKSFISFTRTERIGLIALCGLLVILLAVRLTMHLWVHPPLGSEKEKKLIAAWDSFKHKQSLIKDTIEKNKSAYKDAFDDEDNPLPATIDLNTADSAMLIRLRGIGPVTAHRIIEWRAKNGPFTSIDQLNEVGSFSKTNFELLKKHLVINSPK
jgi:competence ComEA-like helix-hairpin-helix protein